MCVGDLLRAADEVDFQFLTQTLQQLEVGPVSRLVPDSALGFSGMQIVMDKSSCIGLRAKPFILAMQEVRLNDVLEGSKLIIDQTRLETLARQIAGSFLWVSQLYFHIGYELTLLATAVRSLGSNATTTRDFLLGPNRIIRELQSTLEVFFLPGFCRFY